MLGNSRGGVQGPSPHPHVLSALLCLGTLTFHTQTSFWEDTPICSHKIFLENVPERNGPEKEKEKKRKVRKEKEKRNKNTRKTERKNES